MACRRETSRANTIGENLCRERAARRADLPPHALSQTKVLENQVRNLTATVRGFLQAIQGGPQALAPLNAPGLEEEPMGGFPDAKPPLAPVLGAPGALHKAPVAPKGSVVEDEGHGKVREIPKVREVEEQC